MRGQPDTGLDLDRLADEVDGRLEAADAALARAYPGERPGRQPVHTVYVPADRFHADLVAAYGAEALRAVDEHEAVLLELLDGDEALLQRVRDKLGQRAGRGPADRLRGRLRPAARRRGGPRGGVRRAGPPHRPRRRVGAARHGHPLQEPRAPHPSARAADPGAVRHDADRRRPAARRLRRHPPQGHVRRPGGGAGARRRPRSSPGWAWSRGRCASRSRSRRRSRSSAPTAPPSSPG